MISTTNIVENYLWSIFETFTFWTIQTDPRLHFFGWGCFSLAHKHKPTHTDEIRCCLLVTFVWKFLNKRRYLAAPYCVCICCLLSKPALIIPTMYIASIESYQLQKKSVIFRKWQFHYRSQLMLELTFVRSVFKSLSKWTKYDVVTSPVASLVSPSLI